MEGVCRRAEFAQCAEAFQHGRCRWLFEMSTRPESLQEIPRWRNVQSRGFTHEVFHHVSGGPQQKKAGRPRHRNSNVFRSGDETVRKSIKRSGRSCSNPHHSWQEESQSQGRKRKTDEEQNSVEQSLSGSQRSKKQGREWRKDQKESQEGQGEEAQLRRRRMRERGGLTSEEEKKSKRVLEML